MLSYASLTNLCFACQFPPEGCAERQSLGPLEPLAVHEFRAWVLAGRGRKEGVCWQLIRYCCFALPLPADDDHPLLLLDWMPRGGWGRRRRAGSCWLRGSSGGWWRGWRGGRSGHRGGPPSSGQTAPTSLRLSDLWLLVLCVEGDLLRLGCEILNFTLYLVDWEARFGGRLGGQSGRLTAFGQRSLKTWKRGCGRFGADWPAAAAILRLGRQVGPETINYINPDAHCAEDDWWELIWSIITDLTHRQDPWFESQPCEEKKKKNKNKETKTSVQFTIQKGCKRKFSCQAFKINIPD